MFPGQEVVTFNASQQLQRPGLTLTQGQVYAAFGSRCGASPFSPWIFAFDAYSIQLTNSYTQPPAGKESGPGIWQAGAGAMPTERVSAGAMRVHAAWHPVSYGYPGTPTYTDRVLHGWASESMLQECQRLGASCASSWDARCCLRELGWLASKGFRHTRCY